MFSHTEGLSRLEQVRCGSLDIHDAARSAVSGEVREQLETRGETCTDLSSAFRVTAPAPAFSLCWLRHKWRACGSPCLSGRDVSKGTELVHPRCERDCRVRIVGKSVVPGELSETVTTPHRAARKKKKNEKRPEERKM